MLVELKNGDTYNGHLVNCDSWMNINLREVICTSRDGDRFWRLPECYIRGNTIKYLRIPDEVIDMVHEEDFNRHGESLAAPATGIEALRLAACACVCVRRSASFTRACPDAAAYSRVFDTFCSTFAMLRS